MFSYIREAQAMDKSAVWQLDLYTTELLFLPGKKNKKEKVNKQSF